MSSPAATAADAAEQHQSTQLERPHQQQQPAAPPHPDLQAIASMITAARDHAASFADETQPGTRARQQIDAIAAHLNRADKETAWLIIYDAPAAEKRRRLDTHA